MQTGHWDTKAAGNRTALQSTQGKASSVEQGLPDVQMSWDTATGKQVVKQRPGEEAGAEQL